jgi:archaellum component FlaC
MSADEVMIRQMIAQELDIKIRSIIEGRLDRMQEQLNKLEKIDSIIKDIKSLFS